MGRRSQAKEPASPGLQLRFADHKGPPPPPPPAPVCLTSFLSPRRGCLGDSGFDTVLVFFLLMAKLGETLLPVSCPALPTGVVLKDSERWAPILVCLHHL